MSQETGPGDAFDLPIRTAPDWLTAPARGGTPREPWYYGFLEQYARVVLAFSLLTFAAVALAFLAFWLFPEAVMPVYRSAFAPAFRGALVGPAGGHAVRDLPAFGGRVVVALAVLGVGFLGFLLPVLSSVAYILLCVDAGRNLRAIRGGRPGG